MINNRLISLLKTAFARRAAFLLLALVPFSISAEQAKKPSPYWDGFNFNAMDNDRYFAILSPYTAHFSPSDEHEYVWLAGFERERSSGIVAGFAYFSNSFGQPSVYY